MKTVKKAIATIALAIMLIPTLPPSPVQAQEHQPGVIETYMNCVNYCVDNYASWTLRRSACGFDCYLSFYGNVIGALLGPALSVN